MTHEKDPEAAALDLEVFKSVYEYGRLALNSAILVNGGASVAMLALLGSLVEAKAQFHAALLWALLCFAIGVFAGGVATGCTYLSQYHYVHSTDRPTPARWRTAAVWFAGGSFMVFLLGVVFALIAFARGISAP